MQRKPHHDGFVCALIDQEGAHAQPSCSGVVTDHGAPDRWQAVDAVTDDGKKDARHLALTDFCQVLLGVNEFIYVD